MKKAKAIYTPTKGETNEEIHSGVGLLNHSDIQVNGDEEAIDFVREVHHHPKNNGKRQVMKIVGHMTDVYITDKDILKIARLGKKVESGIRSLLIMFENVKTKDFIMSNVFNVKSLDDELKSVVISMTYRLHVTIPKLQIKM
ncbi:hypothetical protein HELRODRAFT_176189 [Helobdella robusta]|uniref:Uncharacterized protein n=1 Tax=Helobdella robusta TaxID=6412 RepID=T1FAA0_HELRO|nr:hypothetical protein HELRODRAFT_176189 [Helobdella robusta]ESO00320.1 hypothetical protein HELRODRAFT_176189 [Helobdella robusta]